jgi:DNA-binding NtrC family response regulator
MNLLFVDDEQRLRELMAKEMAATGHSVTCAANGQEALSALDSQAFDVVILDLKMPGMGGMEVFRRIRADGLPSEVLVLTGQGSLETAVEALRLGAWDYLTKPCRLDELDLTLQRIGEFQKLRQENRALRMERNHLRHQPILVGQSPAIHAIRRQIEQIAPSDATVLIHGETGTGKELVANALHDLSTRKDGPFVLVDCAGITESLMESELFGHERGAFTGASQQREGLIEVAHRGTVFFDEIAELPLHLQAKLLRVVQGGEVRRVGSSRPRNVDVRVLCATNRDLRQAVSSGQFRQDLFYRIQVVEIQVPPLREHPEDIPVLIQEFLRRHPSPRLKRLDFSPEATEFLSSWSWPGNVRELENVVQRISLLAQRSPVEMGDLHQCGVFPSASPSAGGGESLEQVERAHILRVLEETGGNKPKAADILGISLKTLYNKLAAYNPPL